MNYHNKKSSKIASFIDRKNYLEKNYILYHNINSFFPSLSNCTLYFSFAGLSSDHFLYFLFPPSKIQKWFSHHNHGNSVTIDLPSNLYHDNDLMGLILYASFSIHGDIEPILNYLESGIPHFLYCECQSSIADEFDKVIHCKTHRGEIIWLHNIGEFIWIYYIICEPINDMLQHRSHIEATFVTGQA